MVSDLLCPNKWGNEYPDKHDSISKQPIAILDSIAAVKVPPPVPTVIMCRAYWGFQNTVDISRHKKISQNILVAFCHPPPFHKRQHSRIFQRGDCLGN